MTVSKKNHVRGIRIKPDDVALEGKSGEIKVGASSQKIEAYLNGASRSVVTEDQSQTLTNKTIDADDNTITDLEVDNLKAGVLNVSSTLTGATDTQVPSALAAKTYAASEASTVQTNLTNHINDTVDAHDASAISNIPSGNLVATDVQAALNELQSDIDTNTTAISNHLSDTIDAHDASAISNVPSGNLSATDVQSALNELQTDIDTNTTNITNHLSDTVDAHDASAISNVPFGNLAATDVQSALNELQTDIDSRAAATVLTAHTGATSGVHGVTGNVVGTTDTQDISNKTFTNPVILEEQGATPSTPSAGDIKLYAKTDSNLYFLNDVGVETQVGGTSAPDPTTMSDVVATRLGYKQYFHGTTYNAGIAPTVTGTSFTNIRSRFIPYQMQDGSWRMRFNITGTRASGASITLYTLTINGVVFRNTASDNQALTISASNLVSDRDIGHAIANPNTATITAVFASNNILDIRFSGDVELNAKPTWAY